MITFAFFSVVQAWAADPPPVPEKLPAILASLDAGKVTVLDDKAAQAIRGQAYQYVLVRTVLNAFDFAPDIQWSPNPFAYRYGAWGGPGWTNGGGIGPNTPADLMDTLFMLHDQSTLSDTQLIGALQLLATTPNAFWGSIGPQIQVPVGPVQPYMNAAIGFMALVTSTSVRGSDSQYEYASTTNSDDVTSAYIFGGGLYVPFGTQKTWKLHVGARYFYGGEATYLTEGDIIDNSDGSVTLQHRHSKTDQVTWQLGVSYTFPQQLRRRR